MLVGFFFIKIAIINVASIAFMAMMPIQKGNAILTISTLQGREDFRASLHNDALCLSKLGEDFTKVILDDLNKHVGTFYNRQGDKDFFPQVELILTFQSLYTYPTCYFSFFSSLFLLLRIISLPS